MGESMRVAIITLHVLEPYLGPSVVAYNTLRGLLKIQSELEKEGVEIVFLSINDKVKEKNWESVSVKAIKRYPPVTFTGEVQALLSKPKDYFDIVHSHSLYDIFPWLLKKDVAKIFHLHGIVWKVRKYMNTFGKFWTWLYERRLKLYYPKLTRVATISNYVIEELENKGFDASKAVLIENPIGDEFFQIKKNEDEIILYPATIIPRKNQFGFLKALSMIKDDLKDFKVVLTGSGEKAYMEKVRDFARKENLNVEFTGKVPFERMLDLYSRASIVALVSFEESFGVAVAEAMATGTPVLVSNIGGLRDTVKHGETGLKADPYNPKDIAEKLLILIEDENLRKRLGENAKKEAERRWRCEIIAKKLLELYLEVLENC